MHRRVRAARRRRMRAGRKCGTFRRFTYFPEKYSPRTKLNTKSLGGTVIVFPPGVKAIAPHSRTLSHTRCVENMPSRMCVCARAWSQAYTHRSTKSCSSPRILDFFEFQDPSQLSFSACFFHRGAASSPALIILPPHLEKSITALSVKLCEKKQREFLSSSLLHPRLARAYKAGQWSRRFISIRERVLRNLQLCATRE